jgi:hypothetical protein
MRNSNRFEEPCFLDYKDAPPEYFHPRPEPPAGLTWWEGEWPSCGISSLDDLKWWVEYRLENMIWLQESDLFADLGRFLGVQALRNADRYLGRFGKGDHPPRPPDNQLQQVEDVEDALEAVLRYLQQQGQPTAADLQRAQPPPPGDTTAAPQPRKPRWRQADVDRVIQEHIDRHADQLARLRDGAQANQKKAIEAARALIGRNEISRALGVCKAQVSKSPVYRQISNEFNLERVHPALKKSEAIRLDIALVEKAMSEGDPVVEEVARREAADIIKKKLGVKEAELLLSVLERGTVSPDKAIEMARVMAEHRDDYQPPRKRH